MNWVYYFGIQRYEESILYVQYRATENPQVMFKADSGIFLHSLFSHLTSFILFDRLWTGKQAVNTILTCEYLVKLLGLTGSQTYLHIHNRPTLAFIWNIVSGRLRNGSPIFTFLLALIWSPLPEGGACVLVANFVWLRFGTGQVVCSGSSFLSC